ncbi:lipid A biosynthesis lauroyl acyltransferase [Helicobacter sp. MIT 99-5507]|uniref:lipid A biosynthesis lauroyl acyltransferase n=1 Tax=Helicobacter sp. MIT 99-5507 TaxID=152489 RepID=UPI0015F186B4|nr:lipid A biosynthesis lauroyl acyltransferase [Helicobacter sp. MIT 99-5507]
MKITDCFIYIFANVSGFLLSLMSDKIFYFNVTCLAFIFKILDKRRKYDCLNNLTFAYNDTLDSRSKKEILNRSYENFAFVLLNSLRLLFMKKDKYLQKFRVHNIEVIEEAQKNGNFIVLTAHYGDWEGTARFIASRFKDIKLSVVGRLTNFQSINNLMEKSRQNFGSAFLDKKGVSKHLVKLLSKPNNAIGLVIDQHISVNEGIWVKFFGKDVTHSPIASILSRKYDIPILFVHMTLSKDYSHYDIYFNFLTNAIKSENSKDDIAKMTQMQASFTEKIIRQKKDEWFWFHKRFKAKYDYIYKQKPTESIK